MVMHIQMVFTSKNAAIRLDTENGETEYVPWK